MNEQEQSNTIKDLSEIKQSPNELMKMIVINKREFANESIYLYLRETNKGSTAPVYQVKSSIQNLMMEIDMAIQSDLSTEEYDELNHQVNSNDFKDLFRAMERINKWLYENDLTRVFKRRSFI
jgi:hypothetical protein